MSIEDFIAKVSEQLTPTERRIASLVLEDPTLLAFGTVSDLAERARTSRPSIVRFATKLGFEGYTDLQSWIRSEMASKLTSPSERIRQDAESITPTRAGIQESVQQVFQSLDTERLGRLAAPIIQAKNIWILSGETSMAGAVVLRSGLSMVRSGVHLVDEHSTGRELSSATDHDVAVVFDFTRYRRHSVTTARTLGDMGVQIVAITDGPLSPLVSLTEHWCELKIPAVGPFDSSVPAVIAAELIVARVVRLLGTRAQQRIDRLEQLWQATETFLEYEPRRSHNDKTQV